MNEHEQRLWDRIAADRAEHGTPQAIASALTPFPFWGVIAAMVIFIPLALIVSFFVKRHAILAQGGEIVVLDLGFWRYRVLEVRSAVPIGSASLSRDGNRLELDGESFHLEPGWADSADALIALNDSAAG